MVGCGNEAIGQPKGRDSKIRASLRQVLWVAFNIKRAQTNLAFAEHVLLTRRKTCPIFNMTLSEWTSWTSWKKSDAESIGRGYNYPHVIAAYWSLYRIARNHSGLVHNHTWDWYLDQSYQTTKFMFSRNANGRRRVGYVELGLMEGDIILALLNDLKREGWTEKASDVETLMKERSDRWTKEAYPFGSEMAWDSLAMKVTPVQYFGFDDKPCALNSSSGYIHRSAWDPTHVARYGFLYGSQATRIERQLHHYAQVLRHSRLDTLSRAP